MELTIVLSPNTENVFRALVSIHSALQDDPDNEDLLDAAQRLERAIGDYANTGDQS